MSKKKGFNFYKFLTAIGIVFIILPMIILGIMLVAFQDSSAVVFYAVILFVIFWGISSYIFRKRKYYCSECGFRLRETGRYRETGDFYSHEDGNRTVVTEVIEVEYECPICGNTVIISKKHKIGSF